MNNLTWTPNADIADVKLKWRKSRRSLNASTNITHCGKFSFNKRIRRRFDKLCEKLRQHAMLSKRKLRENCVSRYVRHGRKVSMYIASRRGLGSLFVSANAGRWKKIGVLTEEVENPLSRRKKNSWVIYNDFPIVRLTFDTKGWIPVGTHKRSLKYFSQRNTRSTDDYRHPRCLNST